MQNTYTIIGLSLNFIGAWCLAYELLWGYPKSNLKAIAEMRLAGLYEYFEQMDRIIDGWGEPPYTAEEKDNEKKDVRMQMADRVNALKTEISNYGEGHKEKSYIIGLIGAVLLSAGFILQLIDLI